MSAEHLFEEVRKKFEMELPADLVAISHAFKRAGHQLYVVGGSVRDALQGKEPKDYDVATDALPDKVVEIVKTLPGNKVMELGKAFGVVVCVTPTGAEYEIATFRQDIGKGRRPDSVEFTDIENDVKRRDLTINALFYDIDRGEIVDFVGGIQDIEDGVVRAVGDPKERFDEDRLRILRALRFAARMGSELDPMTAQAIERDNSLKGVSFERVRDEFLKGVKSAKDASNFLEMIGRYDLWTQVLPGMRVSDMLFSERDPSVLLALLLDENDPQVVAKKLNGLKYSTSEASQVSFLIRLKSLDVSNAFKLRRAADGAHIADEQMESYVAERGLPHPTTLRAFLKYRPTVSGDELMAAGFSGAALGKEIERRESELFSELVGAA